VRTGPGREPLWPDGIVGSLTHCEGYRAAAVAPRSLVASVGVDAEPHAPLPAEVLPLVTLAQERAGWEGLPGDVAWDRLVFSAKESVYKAWYPLTGQWLGFEDAVVSLRPAGTGPDRGDFEASLLVPPAVVAGREVGVFRGRYLVDRGLVVTAVLVGH
jgi:4'-phosphopantetheinyl transferase EntD